MTEFAWSEQAAAKLKSLWTDGWTSRQCAHQLSAEFQTTISRGSVCSKISRMGLLGLRSVGWTDERVERLKTLLDDDLSCAKIATELGGGVSRNAVISKIHRMGWARGPKQARGRSTNRVVTNFRRTKSTGPDFGKVEVLELPPEDPTAAVSLLELNEHHCRWPVGSPGTNAMRYCGVEPVEGYPYCRRHKKMAYQRPVRRSAPRPFRNAI